MQRYLIVLATACIAVVIAAAPGGAVTPKAVNGSAPPKDCGDGDSITYSGPLTLWPPNHKYRTATITAIEGGAVHTPNGTTVSSMGTHDEIVSGVEMRGAGHTAMDVKPPTASAMGTGSASVQQMIRGERSGKGDGRTYTFTVRATFHGGLKTCDTTFTATVPHDMGN